MNHSKKGDIPGAVYCILGFVLFTLLSSTHAQAKGDLAAILDLTNTCGEGYGPTRDHPEHAQIKAQLQGTIQKAQSIAHARAGGSVVAAEKKDAQEHELWISIKNEVAPIIKKFGLLHQVGSTTSSSTEKAQAQRKIQNVLTALNSYLETLYANRDHIYPIPPFALPSEAPPLPTLTAPHPTLGTSPHVCRPILKADVAQLGKSLIEAEEHLADVSPSDPKLRELREKNPSTTFDPASEECQNWVLAHKLCNDSEKSFRAAQALLSAVKFVSAEKFDHEMKKTMDQIALDIRSNPTKKFIWIYPTARDTKSQEWIFAKYYNVLMSKLTPQEKARITFQASKGEAIQPPQGVDKNTEVILVDDGIYSGSQMEAAVGRIRRDGFRVIRAYTPYITPYSLDRIKNKAQVSYQNLMPTTQGISKTELETISQTYASGRDLSQEPKAIQFFAHKMPDAMSALPIFHYHTVECYDEKTEKTSSLKINGKPVEYSCFPCIRPPYKMASSQEPDNCQSTVCRTEGQRAKNLDRCIEMDAAKKEILSRLRLQGTQ